MTTTTTERQAIGQLARRMQKSRRDADADPRELSELDDALLAVWIELWPEGGQG